jgi:ribonuclease Z
MRMKLTLLGTGNAMATRCYNTCFALRSGAACFLVDAGGGNGVLRQLELAQLPAESIEGMFITHGHTDHILGAIWIVRKMAELMKKGAYAGEFVIRCHQEAAEMLNAFCKMTLAPAQLRYVGNGIRILPISPGGGI